MLVRVWEQVREAWSRGGWWGLRKIFTRDMPEGFLRNVGWQYGGTAASSAVHFLYTLLVARALGVTQFGLIALALGVAALVSQFAILRQREMTIRYIVRFREENDFPRMLATVKLSLLLDLGSGATAFLITMLLSPWVAGHVLRDANGVLIIALAALAYVAQNLSADTALALLRVFSRFGLLAAVEVSGATFKLLAALGVVYGLHWGVLGVLAVLVATNLLVNLTLLALALRELRRFIPIRADAPLSLIAPHGREIRRFLTHIYIASIPNLAWADMDITLVGYFVSKEAAGVYKIAKSCTVALGQVADAVFLAVYPELATLWTRKAIDRLRAFVRRLTLVTATTAVVLYGTAFFAAPWAIALLMRSEYAGAGRLFRLMGWGMMLWAPLLWVGPLLAAAGRTDVMLRASLESSVIVVGLYLVAVPLFGAAGAALVYALSTPILVALMFWLGRRAGVIFPSSVASPVSPP